MLKSQRCTKSILMSCPTKSITYVSQQNSRSNHPARHATRATRNPSVAFNPKDPWDWYIYLYYIYPIKINHSWIGFQKTNPMDGMGLSTQCTTSSFHHHPSSNKLTHSTNRPVFFYHPKPVAPLESFSSVWRPTWAPLEEPCGADFFPVKVGGVIHMKRWWIPW